MLTSKVVISEEVCIVRLLSVVFGVLEGLYFATMFQTSLIISSLRANKIFIFLFFFGH